jgi:CHAT domain-containing protein
VYYKLGAFQESLNYTSMMGSQDGQLPGNSSYISLMRLIGDIHYELGNYQESLHYYGLARSDDLLISIAKIHYLLGNYQQALDYYHRARNLDLKAKEKFRESYCFFSHEWQVNFPTKAMYYKGKCNGSEREVDEKDILTSIGDVHKKSGNNEQAIIYYKNALTFALNVINYRYKNEDNNLSNYAIYHKKNPSLMYDFNENKAIYLYRVGNLYEKLGDNQHALTYLERSLTINQSINNKIRQPYILFNLAKLYRSKNNFKQALDKIELAIKIAENSRTKIINPDLRTSYFARFQDYYRLKIDLLMQLHRQQPNKGYDIRAIEASESARARGLLDLLTEAKADIKQGVDPQLLAQERAIQSKLDAAEKRRINILNEKGTLPPNFEQEYNSLNQQYEQNKDQIRLKSPRYAAITQPKPLKFAQIQQLLDDKTVLLEYSLGENQSYLWLVTKNSIDSYQLPKSAEIKNIVDKYLPILTSKSGYTTAKIQIDKIAPQLKAILPDAVANKLTNKRIVVVADGALQYLPFGSLPTGADNQPLLLTNEVINLPSASTLGIIRSQNLRSKASKTVAVFADPVFASDDVRLTNKPVKTTEISTEIQSLERAARENGIKFSRLTNTKKEADTILQLAGDRSKLNLNFDANLVNATNSDLVNYRIVHFATHGIMDGIDPKRSGVVLSLFNKQGGADNGYLRLPNIFNLKLDADLVVLSACQTGIGKEIQGEGLVGITRGFMYAGTPRVVVSLWSVDDEATSILMGNFYTGILKQGLTPAAALRQAQQTMMRDPKYQSPYYWAAFTLQGEWK